MCYIDLYIKYICIQQRDLALSFILVQRVSSERPPNAVVGVPPPAKAKSSGNGLRRRCVNALAAAICWCTTMLSGMCACLHVCLMCCCVCEFSAKFKVNHLDARVAWKPHQVYKHIHMYTICTIYVFRLCVFCVLPQIILPHAFSVVFVRRNYAWLLSHWYFMFEKCFGFCVAASSANNKKHNPQIAVVSTI